FAQLDLTVRTVGPEPLIARLLPHQIDVLDAEGTRFQIGAIQVEAGRSEARVHLSLMSTARPKATDRAGRPSFEGKGPAQLRFHRMFRAPVDGAFTFEDLPLP